MDRLWKVELAYEKDPQSVSKKDKELYRSNMSKMVKKVLSGDDKDLMEAETISYEQFMSRLKAKKVSSN